MISFFARHVVETSRLSHGFMSLSSQTQKVQAKNVGGGLTVISRPSLMWSEGYRPSCARPSQEPRAAVLVRTMRTQSPVTRPNYGRRNVRATSYTATRGSFRARLISRVAAQFVANTI